MPNVEVTTSGKFFVLNNLARLAKRGATRLAHKNPGKKFIVQQFLEGVIVDREHSPNVGRTKENAMKKTVWYGVGNGNVHFASSQSQLTSQGVENPSSFEVDGEITGLDITDNETIEASANQAPAAAQPQG